jgi:heat shock protein 4
MRDKISESGKLGPFIAPATRETFTSDLGKAEEWLWDHPESPKLEYIEKLQELQVHGTPVLTRYKEADARDEATKELQDTINRYRALAQSPDEKYEHISAENKKKISDECAMVEGWLAQKKQQQADAPTFEDPVLKIEEMALKGKDIAQMSDKILSEPKPKPPTPEPKAEEPKAEEKPAEEAKPEEPAEEAPNDPSLDVD